MDHAKTTSTTATPRFLPALAVAVLGAVALGLRLWQIGDKSIWLDEAWSWRAARLSLPDMVDWTAQDKHPPLYYGVLHLWTNLFGDSEAMLRAPSAIASAAAVVLLASVGWRRGGPLLGLLAGTLLALNPTHVEFAQEARMYALAGTLALASTLALAAVIDRPSVPRASLYVLLATCLVYTHYSGFLVLGVHAALVAAYGVAHWRADPGRGRRMFVFGAGSLAAVAIAYAPWYGHLLDSTRDGVGHLPEPSWTLIDLVFSALLGLQRASGFWLAIALPVVGLGLWGVYRRRADPYIVCVAAIALVPCLQLVFSALRSPVFDVRQTAPYVPGFALLLALGLVELGQYVADTLSRRSVALPISFAGAAGVALVMLTGCSDWYNRGPREDWRAAAADVDAVPGAVYIWRGYIDEPLHYYTDHSFSRFAPSGGLEQIEAPVASALILSHHTPAEADAIIRTLSDIFRVGEGIDRVGITVYPLTPH